jgi:methylthioribulose-1-phosphate dehydratase
VSGFSRTVLLEKLSPMLTAAAVARSFREIGEDFYARGWVLGTSGNFSAVVSRKPLRLVITASSISKGAIRLPDVLTINGDGNPVGPGDRAKRRPSAETFLHLAIVRTRGAGAVLHTHSVWSTMLSELHASEGGLTLTGFEMLKGLEGVRTHEHAEWIPVFENDQDMVGLSQRVENALQERPGTHGFLLRGHGLYTWGDDLAQARRHIEIFEFLLETAGRMKAMGTHGADQHS